MDRQTVERRREYVQNIRNSFYEENGMQKRETREVDDSAPEMGLAAALKLRIFLSVCIFAAFLGCMYTPYGFVWLQHADDHRNDL